VASLVFVVTAMLLLMLLQSWVVSKRKMSRARCASNLMRIGMGLAMYADDYNGRLPPPGTEGLGLMRDYLGTRAGSPFHCPVDRIRHEADTNAPLDEAHCSYVYIGGVWARSSRSVDSESQSKAVARTVPVCWDKPENHDNWGLNVLFNDGHLEWMDLGEWEKIRPDK
jgi:prepilin-type processing-associated H-X9-DG protein